MFNKCDDHQWITEEEEEVCVRCGIVRINQDLLEINRRVLVDNEEFMKLNYYGNIDILTEKLAMSNIIPHTNYKYKKLSIRNQKLAYKEKDVLIYRMNRLLLEKYKIPYSIIYDAYKQYLKYLRANGKKINKIKYCHIMLDNIKGLNITKDRLEEIKYALMVNLHLKRLSYS